MNNTLMEFITCDDSLGISKNVTCVLDLLLCPSIVTTVYTNTLMRQLYILRFLRI